MSTHRSDVAEEPSPPSSQRPTLRPAVASGMRLRETARRTARVEPIQEILARFELGDYTGALAVAARLLDDGRVPVVTMASRDLDGVVLGVQELALLQVIDGRRNVEEVLDASGMQMIDAFRALCEMAEKGLVVLI
jgi:hypothetical protein